MTVRVKKTGRKSDKLLRNLQSLNNSSVEIGHFTEQGLHSSGLTYPHLLAVWDFGVVEGQEGVQRRPLLNFSFEQVQSGELTNSPEFKQAMNEWARNALNTNADEELLDDVGKLARDKYKEVFGKIGRFMPPDSTGTPMFETGELKSATAYRTSKNKQIKEG